MELWLKGLIAAVIGGAATAGSAWMAMSAAGAAGVDVPVLNFKALGIIMLAGGVTNLLAFLKTSPIPTSSVETTVTVKKEVTHESD